MSKTICCIAAMISVLSASSAFAGGAIQIARNVPYFDDTTAPTNIANECTDLGSRLSTSLHQFATKYGVETVLVDEIDPKSEGTVFEIQITRVFSRGNAFIGHQKSMSVTGELFVNGKSQGRANFSRDSTGGFGAGFKGSCSVLARCSKTLGNDLAKWLRDRK